jgi:ribosomal protein S18 acetylase RimI-like enzyme
VTPRVRVARTTDAAAIARVHVETWQSTYAGVIPDAYLVRLSHLLEGRPRQVALAPTVRESTLVAEAEGAGVVGFASFGPVRRAGLPPGTRFLGEVYTLYVLPDYQGRGLGRALLDSAFTSLAARGRRSAIIWVLEANPSRFFYEHLGGVRVARRTERFAGADLGEVAYGWERVLID